MYISDKDNDINPPTIGILLLIDKSKLRVNSNKVLISCETFCPDNKISFGKKSQLIRCDNSCPINPLKHFFLSS